jgi:uncharacterized protein (TIGR00255 family)
MTGFGIGDAPLGAGRVVVEARTVNGRYLDVKVRTPRELSEYTGTVELETRKLLARGRCEVTVRTEGSVLAAPVLDKERARAGYRMLLELRDELSKDAEVPFSMLSIVPDLFRSPLERDFDSVGSAIVRAAHLAFAALDAMRTAEGEKLALELGGRVVRARAVVAELARSAPSAVQAAGHRLRERVARLLSDPSSGAGAPDSVRLEQEIAILADRADITEELARLAIHLERMVQYLAGEGPTGRRLDFLLQEMSREINTVGAKSQDVAIAHAVVEMKAEIERMREQVQNVE